MNELNKYDEYAYLAYLTESRQVGESTKRSPQHMTLVPPFPFNISLVKIQEAVHEVAADTRTFQVKVAEEAKFGPMQRIDVRIIRPVNVVKALHYQLMYSLASRGINLSDRFVYDGFMPHITIKPSHTTDLTKGQILTVDHIAIMHKDKGHRTLLAREELRSETAS